MRLMREGLRKKNEMMIKSLKTTHKQREKENQIKEKI